MKYDERGMDAGSAEVTISQGASIVNAPWTLSIRFISSAMPVENAVFATLTAPLLLSVLSGTRNPPHRPPRTAPDPQWKSPLHFSCSQDALKIQWNTKFGQFSTQNCSEQPVEMAISVQLLWKCSQNPMEYEIRSKLHRNCTQNPMEYEIRRVFLAELLWIASRNRYFSSVALKMLWKSNGIRNSINFPPRTALNSQ